MIIIDISVTFHTFKFDFTIFCRRILDSGGELQQKAGPGASTARGAAASKTKEDDSDAPQIAFSPTIRLKNYMIN